VKNFSFITLLSYDYKYAFNAIRSYYDLADEIILGLDSEYITWSKNKFEFSEDELNKFLAEDTAGKIRVVRGNFHQLARPIDNDTAERTFLAQHCKDGNWIIQIDADESLLNPKDFVSFMDDNADVLDGCAIKAHWITVFKSFGDVCLVIDADGDTDGRIFVGTRSKNAYTTCRDTREMAIQTPLRLLHYSWGRSREELKQKLENWGHSKDFDTNAYLELWDKITLDNYTTFKDLHPLHGPHWPRLKKISIEKTLQTQGDRNEL
jgi:hypothetical protein